MRGRKPKPTLLKIMGGNAGKRKLNDREPQPAPGIPQCPKHLTGEARAEWSRIVVQLSRMGVLSLADRAAIGGYCVAYGRWAAAETFVKRRGMMYKHAGLLKVNPAVRVAHDAALLMHRFLSEFGLSPASRTRIKVDGDGNEETEADEFFRDTGS